MNLTRGIRNNNPLNIRRSADRWEGAAEMQTDPDFVQFQSLTYGYRAAWKVLQSYWLRFRKEGSRFTVRNIIGRWAPPQDDNDTEGYIRSVLLIGGLGGKEHLLPPENLSGYHRMERLLVAMTCVECGIRPEAVDTRAIRDGYCLAFPGACEIPPREDGCC